jgi:predicted ATP-grasp superfamily ATP-dependent carboligase
MIFKPLDGVGCEGLSIVKDRNEIVEAVKKVMRESASKQFIAQNRVKGKAASACMISNGYKALSITLNRQLVTLASPNEKSGYHGGTVPFEHKLGGKALKLAEKAVEAASGLKGYVGVDMILTDEEPVIIEINPRLTVSYVGLRKAMNFNPAETIIDAVIGRKLPSNIHNKGYVFFSKVQIPALPQIVSETYKLKDVVSPPFPIEENIDYALIATFSKSLKGAQSSFYRTKKCLLKLYSRGE